MVLRRFRAFEYVKWVKDLKEIQRSPGCGRHRHVCIASSPLGEKRWSQIIGAAGVVMSPGHSVEESCQWLEDSCWFQKIDESSIDIK